ncbi:CarD family transcriptional regulator [Anaerotignum sp.]|nr:CarD family transcriptional regulator [Anaerotignum sp.]MBQ7759213.1 CarD family transcriptional regulator [Anaerotignum sp.]
MFQKGEYVIYGNNGICRIEEIGIPVGTPMGRSGKEYYTLAPVFGSGSIYAPVDTKVFMRAILTKEQAEHLIEQIPDIQEEEFEGRDVRALSEKYKGCLDTHQCEDLVKLIKTVYIKEKTMVENGKKLAKTEQEFGKLAKELLHREFSMALGIPYEEVEVYITEKVNALSK